MCDKNRNDTDLSAQLYPLRALPMNTDTLLAPLERALSQSQALLSLARADDWESFETLVQQRQQGLLSIQDTEYLQSLAAAELGQRAAVLVREIQTINEQLANLAETRKTKLVSDLRQAGHAAKAIDAYGR